jgi:uncharacterized protein (TIGR03435 family)
MLGVSIPAMDVVLAAYDFDLQRRVILKTNLPPGRFDFIASLQRGNKAALRKEIQRRFGVVAKRETLETQVLLLKVRFPNAPGLKPSARIGQQQSVANNEYTCSNLPITYLADYLETYIGIPVLDRTGLAGTFDLDLKWNEEQDENGKPLPGPLNSALLEELGLELVPSSEPIEMLLVEPAA